MPSKEKLISAGLNLRARSSFELSQLEDVRVCNFEVDGDDDDDCTVPDERAVDTELNGVVHARSVWFGRVTNDNAPRR